MPNWRSAPVIQSLSFAEKLGLPLAAKFIAFDFWNQKLLGVFQGRMAVEVAGHDTRVLFLHPLLNRPNLSAFPGISPAPFPSNPLTGIRRGRR